ncbi:hypothetical protein NQ317_014133 [Molorchus minor]|uniref:Uncharacterized protein n=1 Tax=Molorchus minor TaxID=1323400 RepID=A0ABQ9JGX0_9CUCU|nr:hypothetical protein NQ317_014133 [Molorchus minor]
MTYELNRRESQSRGKRNSQDASGTRPFGQPLCIGPQLLNENGLDALPLTPKSPSPTPSKGKHSPVVKKGPKTKKNKHEVFYECCEHIPDVGDLLCRIFDMSLAPHSPRRQKLNLRMKSLSLDSPESTEHVRRGKHPMVNPASDPHSNQSSSSRIQFGKLSTIRSNFSIFLPGLFRVTSHEVISKQYQIVLNTDWSARQSAACWISFQVIDSPNVIQH